ncbi:MAG TPA: hypothetical protein PK781_02330 [Terrimesophilobacter sp.]|nr:hypothetical protein [Terrimesophilobacter sp.]
MSRDAVRNTNPSTPDDELDQVPPGAAVRAGSNMRRFLSRWLPMPPPSFLGRLFGVSPLPRESGRDYREANAEYSVATIAASLGDDWHVIHGVNPCGESGVGTTLPRDDVSHVLIGERGVFALTTVNPGGASVWVSANSFVHDGARMSHLRDAEFNALRLSQKLYERSGLRVEVVPGVVVANPRRLIVDRRPQRVSVLRPREIASWVQSHPPIISGEESDALAHAANTLGRVGENPPLAQVLERFGDVHALVNRAERRRVAWIAVTLLAVWFVLVAVSGWL